MIKSKAVPKGKKKLRLKRSFALLFSFIFLRHIKNDHATMLEGFSTYEGAKGKSNKRVRKAYLKSEVEYSRK